MIRADEACDYSLQDVHISGGPHEVLRPIYKCAHCGVIVMRCWRGDTWNWAVPPIFEERP